MTNTNFKLDSSDYCNKMYPSSCQFSFSITQANQFEANNHISELKFKIESVGHQPENDDDLDMCPARTRICWPKQIIPWWVASEPNEKPPYSYATLIAHAILSSKDGRLTLNDIYIWIAKAYPAFSIGRGGWQNSIRHNLSLNKKWFCKMERRPTQANPGKGCYWTLVPGIEHIFIDNLTQECGYNRKHHDIGLTTELSSGQRRGVCYYRNNHMVTESNNGISSSQKLSNTEADTSAAVSKPNSTRLLNSPLYTTFRMTPGKSPASDDSDNDSGVDFGHEHIGRKHPRKRRRTNSSRKSSTEMTQQDVHCDKAQHADRSMVHGTPTSSKLTSFGLMSDSSMDFEINSWIEQSLIDSDLHNDTLCASKDTFHNHPSLLPLPQMPNWCDSNSTVGTSPRKSPITIHLVDVSPTYLHFEQEQPFETNYCSLYPSYNGRPQDFTSPSATSHLQQFVSMQDLLYS